MACRTDRHLADALTLVEILIILVLMGIVALLVIPTLSDAAHETEIATLAACVKAVQAKIEEHRMRHGDWPETISPNWFAGDRLPEHPGNCFGATAIQIEYAPGKAHPAFKVLKSGVAVAYWYNPAGGAFRARVTDQGTAAKTLDAYNSINHATEHNLGNYQGPGR